jgi:hypothetical protein
MRHCIGVWRKVSEHIENVINNLLKLRQQLTPKLSLEQ